EQELVGGYMTEYAGVRFALFYLAEFMNTITVSAVAVTLFLGGPSGPHVDFLPALWPVVWFFLKLFVFVSAYVWLRATLPRLRFHGRHVLNRYEDGMEKYIGCELCAGVCPARCIYVRGADNPPDDPVSPGERYGFVYEINYLRCIPCDLCVEACPTEAITESKLFQFSFTDRRAAIYTKTDLLVDDEGHPRHLPWQHWRAAHAEH